MKQDQDELVAVCKVMEDLIRMHTSIFLVSYSLGVYIKYHTSYVTTAELLNWDAVK